MVKVCQMTSVHKSKDARIFYKECTSLAAAGYDTYLVARGESREENGVHVIGVGQPTGGLISRMMIFCQKVYQAALAINADVYHLHDPELLPYGIKLKKSGKIIIFDSHENYTAQMGSKHYIPQILRPVFTVLYAGLETKAVKQYDAVIVPCTFDGKDIFEGRCARTCFVANYPKMSDFYDKYNKSLRKAPRIVCYVGSIAKERGIIPLIRAVKKAKARLLLVGKCSSDALLEELRAMPEFDVVDYHGSIDNQEVPRVIQQAGFGMHTVLNLGEYFHMDTLGVKVYEYMSVALPIVMSDTPCAKKTIEKYHCGICVKPDDAAEIADAIEYLFNDPDIAGQMGENARRAVEQEYNWATQEKNLLELYASLTGKA